MNRSSLTCVVNAGSTRGSARIVTLVTLVALVALVVSTALLLVCTVQPEPTWATFFDNANKISTQKEFERWDKQAQLVYDESFRYGGKLPPRSPGHGWTYPSALHDLANSYRLAGKQEEAERFYSRALQMENLDYPEQANGTYRHDLIAALLANGKKEEALEQQKLFVEAISKELNTPAYKGSQSHHDWLGREQEKLAEMEKQLRAPAPQARGSSQ